MSPGHWKMVPVRVGGVQCHGFFYQCKAAVSSCWIRQATEHNKRADFRQRIRVVRVELNRSLSKREERIQVLFEEVNISERFITALVRGCQIDGSSSGVQGSTERVRPRIESLLMLFYIRPAQHGTRVCVVGVELDRPFEAVSPFEMFLRSDAATVRVVPTEHALVRIEA